MPRLLVASSNPGKLREFAAAAEIHGIEIWGVPDFSRLPEVKEDAPSFEGNARKKAEFYSLYSDGELVFADDSGLEVDALGGAPGIYSARYAAGPEHPNSTDQDNIEKLLGEMLSVPDEKRSARFVCVIAVAREGKTIATFRSDVEGRILRECHGSGGFGYDPVFYFPALHKTYAELTPEEKVKVSHRGLAFRKLLEWISNDDEEQQ
jgi:XTP/dITP diphosphohydrolase